MAFGVTKLMSKKSLTTLAALGFWAVIAAFVMPGVIRARNTPSAAPCVNNLLRIAGAKQSWALENRKSSNDAPIWDDLRPFLKPTLTCPQGGTYMPGPVGELPRCSIGGSSHTMPQ